MSLQISKICFWVVTVWVLMIFTGCRNGEKPNRRDSTSEFACCIYGNDRKVLVSCDGVLHQFTRQNDSLSSYVETTRITYPWAGRLVSMNRLGLSETCIAVLFDINANTSKLANGHEDHASGFSLHSFRIENGQLTDTGFVQYSVFDARSVDDSTLLTVERSDDFPKSDDFPGDDCTGNFFGNTRSFKLENDGRSVNFAVGVKSNSFCENERLVVFTATSNTPLLVNDRGLVVGKWDRDSNFTFRSQSMDDPGNVSLNEKNRGLEVCNQSFDCSYDQKLLAGAIAFTTFIRVSIWRQNDGKLLTTRNLPNNGRLTGLLRPIRCVTFGNRGFCVNAGTSLNFISLDSEETMVIEAKEIGEEYTGVYLLGIEKVGLQVKATYVLTPFDEKSVRQKACTFGLEGNGTK